MRAPTKSDTVGVQLPISNCCFCLSLPCPSQVVGAAASALSMSDMHSCGHTAPSVLIMFNMSTHRRGVECSPANGSRACHSVRSCIPSSHPSPGYSCTVLRALPQVSSRCSCYGTTPSIEDERRGSRNVGLSSTVPLVLISLEGHRIVLSFFFVMNHSKSQSA